MSELKLISLNIEGDKHWDTVLPFLEKERPDVLCVQEIYHDEMWKLAGYTGLAYISNTMRPHTGKDVPVEFGLAVLTRMPAVKSRSEYYGTTDDTLPVFDMSSELRIHETYWHGYAAVTVDVGGSSFKIISTHCTWTPHGEPEKYQLEDVEDMKRMLAKEGEHILCGDFNIPRSKNPISNLLSQGYTDQIPPEYHGSMDMAFHRTRGTSEAAHVATNMVDYLFTTPAYSARDVHLVGGVSDHKAIVATITRI